MITFSLRSVKWLAVCALAVCLAGQFLHQPMGKDVIAAAVIGHDDAAEGAVALGPAEKGFDLRPIDYQSHCARHVKSSLSLPQPAPAEWIPF